MIRRKLDKLTKRVESAVDMEENDGEFRYPFDKHGNLLPNTDISRRLN